MPQKERETDGARRQSSETEPKYILYLRAWTRAWTWTWTHVRDLQYGTSYLVMGRKQFMLQPHTFSLKETPPLPSLPREGKYSPRISGSKTKCYKLQISGNAWSICRTMSEAKGSPRVASQPQRKRKNLTEKAIWSQYGHSVRSMGVVGGECGMKHGAYIRV